YLHNANTLIVGDFNLPTYECGASDSSCPSVKTLLDFLHFLSLSQYNNVHALVPEDAYHPALTWIISFERVKASAMLVPGVEERFNFRKHNDINSACTAFYDCVYSIIASFVPKSTSTRSSYPVWFSPKIIRLIKRKRTVWKKAKKSGNQFFRDEFARLRRVVKQEIEFSYRQFVSSAEANITSDPKQFWKFVNLKKKSLGIPSNMTFHDELITNGDDIVNSFAKYFSSVFLLSSNNDFPDITLPNSFHNFKVSTISENLVFDKLKNLKPKFTNGPDSIPAFVIKDCAAVFTKPLTFLFNLVLVSSKFPDRWKISKIVPLFKGGNRALIENYRPISILNNFAKVFELTLVEGLRHQCKNLIVGNQHGFVQGRSTVTNLLTITQHLSNNLDNQHINTLTSDAVKLLGFIIRNSSSINNEAIIKLLYYSLVRSKLEYAAIVWYPHYTKYIHDIENVQRRFLKYLHFKINRTYPPRGTTQEHLLQTFSIPSIDHRVRIQYLCFFVKTINYEINCSHLLSLFNFNCPKFRIRSNNILYLPTPRTNILKYSPIHNICRM
ncbi:uncharacterized protein LOC135121243, partial [Zophobas morio]|uniref:uncharacterized protein LOC135121243 n=1 Tax=Zophobas morio TaxID=2755281 RepID=UPI003082C831